MILDLFRNYVLIIPACTWIVAQLTKMVIALIKGDGLDLSYMLSSGGMPSAHSAVVSALATAIAMKEGLGSTSFGIAVILALIVMYDSAGVRQAVGQQSMVVNRIVSELKKHQPLITLEADLRELVGHTPFQVIVGAAMGVAIAWTWLIIAGV
ncbi:MAG: divergent PAP2 family protein [Dehalococcoidales bacterium]|nr:divergent PAP2 family protein [Dehalococcoidales bacterium]